MAQRIGGPALVGAKDAGLSQRDDRQPGSALVHGLHLADEILERAGIAFRAFGAEDDRRQPLVRTGDDAGVLARVDEDRLPAAALELALDLAQPRAGHRLGGDVGMGDQDRKTALELHSSSSRSVSFRRRAGGEASIGAFLPELDQKVTRVDHCSR